MVGIDEVGRGCLAGPLLVVAARAKAGLPESLRDSKLLSSQQRREILNMISSCCEFGEGWATAAEIDSHGLAGALRLGFKRALARLQVTAGELIIVDGKVNYAPPAYKNIRCVIGADAGVPLVSAASVYAKVRRDDFMAKLANQHPAYGFDKHVGYGTAAHIRSLAEHGALKDVHRFSFAPVLALAAKP